MSATGGDLHLIATYPDAEPVHLLVGNEPADQAATHKKQPLPNSEDMSRERAVGVLGVDPLQEFPDPRPSTA